jgi:hypothetical protein
MDLFLANTRYFTSQTTKEYLITVCLNPTSSGPQFHSSALTVIFHALTVGGIMDLRLEPGP